MPEISRELKNAGSVLRLVKQELNSKEHITDAANAGFPIPKIKRQRYKLPRNENTRYRIEGPGSGQAKAAAEKTMRELAEEKLKQKQIYP